MYVFISASVKNENRNMSNKDEYTIRVIEQNGKIINILICNAVSV